VLVEGKQEKLKRLRKENKKQRIEKEIKKNSTFFVKEMK
jgi:hypothetical protein